MPNRPLTGVDVDSETAVAELEALVRALKDGNAHIKSIEHSEQASVEDTATESVGLTYTLSNEFDGIDPLQYTGRNGGGE